jgi:hypothetical protein
MGGAVRAIEDGYQKREIENTAYEHARRVDSGEQVVVGVNRYALDEEIAPQLQRVDERVRDEQVARTAAVRAARDDARCARRSPTVARPRPGRTTCSRRCVRRCGVRATLQEVCDVLRAEFGTHVPQRVLLTAARPGGRGVSPGSMTAAAPGWTTRARVPVDGDRAGDRARSVFSIFIASSVTMGSPSATWSPTSTAYPMTVPCIGASTSPSRRRSPHPPPPFARAARRRAPRRSRGVWTRTSKRRPSTSTVTCCSSRGRRSWTSVAVPRAAAR